MNTSAKLPHVLIVGAGFAGLQAAQTLAKAKLKVTLADKNNYHLFQPLLYQVATTGLNPSEISSVVRTNFRGRKKIKVMKAALTSLDVKAKKAEFDDGKMSLEYDYLIMCVGGKTCYFGNNHWEETAPGLKSLNDAVNIRNRFLDSFEKAELCECPEEAEALTTLVVVGGGPTGVELAGAFAELRSKVLARDYLSYDPKKSRVILLEGGDQLLNGYDPKLAAYTQKRLEKLGVEVKLGQRVTDITATEVVTTTDTFTTSNAIWAAGVEGHPLAKEMGAEVDGRGRIIVEPDLLVKDSDHMYACGDMTYFGHDERFPRGLPGVAQVAMQQGDLAAKNIMAQVAGKQSKAFKYFDKGKMATIGRSAAVAESGPLKMKGFIAWLSWLFIHVIYLVEFQDRIFVFLRWIWAYVSWTWGVRIIFRSQAKSEAAPQDPTEGDTSKKLQPPEVKVSQEELKVEVSEVDSNQENQQSSEALQETAVSEES